MFMAILDDNFFIVSLLLVVVWGFLWGIILNTLAYKKVLRILYEECDPKRFITYCKQIIRQKSVTKIALEELRLHLCKALLDEGNYKEAREVLNMVDGFYLNESKQPKPKKNIYIYKVYILHSLIAIHVCNKDFETARKVFDNMKEYIFNARILSIHHSFVMNLLTLDFLYINFLEGDIENQEESVELVEMLYNFDYEKASNNFERVSAMFMLGVIYVRSKKFNEAKKAFEYVATKGNKLSIVSTAKTYLEKI
ncbi:UNVERIFIED_CONTAM: pentatricopeptide repeat protein [Acetivibrio alkalicellulosi]